MFLVFFPRALESRSDEYFADADVYPTRGEVLIIRAPWIKHGLSYYYEDGHLTYAIPRQSGDVILGGSFQVDDWCVLIKTWILII
jgi:hypothetical protein